MDLGYSYTTRNMATYLTGNSDPTLMSQKHGLQCLVSIWLFFAVAIGFELLIRAMKGKSFILFFEYCD